MNRSPLRALLGAVITVGVAGALLTAPTTATAAPAAPQVGECHALTYRESAARSDTDRSVSCDSSHTSRTIKVVKVSRKVIGNARLTDRAALKGCYPALRQALGGSASSQALSAYDFSYFAPTRAQVRQGAAWIRCDLVLRGGKALLSLPTDETPALGALPHPDNVARCLQVTSRATLRTACAKKHNYRAEVAFKVPAKRYPGPNRLYALAKKRCPQATRSKVWWSTWPSENGWKLGGERQMVCYDDTTA